MFAATHGLKYYTTRFLGELGIGCLNALHCLTNGAVDSGGFPSRRSSMPTSKITLQFAPPPRFIIIIIIIIMKHYITLHVLRFIATLWICFEYLEFFFLDLFSSPVSL